MQSDSKVIETILSHGSTPAQLFLFYFHSRKSNYEYIGVATDLDDIPSKAVLMYEIQYPSLKYITHSDDMPQYLDKILRALQVKKTGYIFFYDSEQPNSFEFIHYPTVPTPAPVTPCFIYDIDSQNLLRIYEPKQSDTLQLCFDTIKDYCKQPHHLHNYSKNLWSV